MNYIINNSHLYSDTLTSNLSNICYTTDVDVLSPCSLIQYHANNAKDIQYSRDCKLYYNTISNTPTTVLTFNVQPCNNVLYNISISVTSSNFTAITSNDSITFTFKNNDTILQTVTKDVRPLYMNVFNLNGKLPVHESSFTVTATSTTPLTPFNMNRTYKTHQHANSFIMC